jgi:hypothetical protein
MQGSRRNRARLIPYGGGIGDAAAFALVCLTPDLLSANQAGVGVFSRLGGSASKDGRAPHFEPGVAHGIFLVLLLSLKK